MSNDNAKDKIICTLFGHQPEIPDGELPWRSSSGVFVRCQRCGRLGLKYSYGYEWGKRFRSWNEYETDMNQWHRFSVGEMSLDEMHIYVETRKGNKK